MESATPIGGGDCMHRGPALSSPCFRGYPSSRGREAQHCMSFLSSGQLMVGASCLERQSVSIPACMHSQSLGMRIYVCTGILDVPLLVGVPDVLGCLCFFFASRCSGAEEVKEESEA